MYGNPYGYPPPMFQSDDPVKSAKRWLKLVREMEESPEKFTGKKKKKTPRTFNKLDVFMLLTIFSPIVGPLYLLMMINIAKHSTELLQTLIK